MTSRRGVTLVELAVAVVVASVVVTMAIRIQLAVERVSRSRLERVGAMTTLRAAAALVAWEWTSLGADSIAGPDLALVDPGRVVYRSQSGLHAVCRLAADSVVLAGARLAEWRARAPVPGRDSLLLYVPGASAAPVDAWLPVPLLAGPTAAPCPGGGRGELYRIALPAFGGPLPDETVARSYESVELRGYGSGSAWQLGQAGLSAGAVVQPVAGPLARADGFAVTAFDRSSVETTSPASATTLEVRIRALAARETAVGPGRSNSAEDSLRVSVRLVNVP